MGFIVDGTAPRQIKLEVVEGLRRRLSLESLPASHRHRGAAVELSSSETIEIAKELLHDVTLKHHLLLRLDHGGSSIRHSDVGNKPPANHWYHYRLLWVDGISHVDEVVEDIWRTVVLPGGSFRFLSTRGATTSTVVQPGGGLASGPATFLGVVRDGLADDGGLFVPVHIEPLTPSHLAWIVHADQLKYQDVAQVILERLTDAHELPPGVLHSFVERAYDASRWGGASNVCPLTPLLRSASPLPPAASSASTPVHVLELYHGPTAAFKDFALQLFPHLFGFSIEGLGNYLILAATSGDTGVAAIVGFLNASSSTKVMVLYPRDGVSPVQKLQMLASDDGTRVRVFGVDADFDYCQSTVKAAFQDTALEAELLKNYHLTLSSANSINYGRLIPQVAYYFWAYRSLVQQQEERIPSLRFDVCVPSGNFGNLLSCFIAKRMGLPVRRLVLASNCNNVLSDFIQTGVYDISSRSLHVTASPSIDILKASNIERFLYYLTEGDTERVAMWMADLHAHGRFEINADLRATMHESFWAGTCSEEECAETIRDVFLRSEGRRILDPHTAVGVFVANAYLRNAASDDHLSGGGGVSVPLVVASTAHWAKFPGPVLAAIGNEDDKAFVAGTADLESLYARIAAHCPEGCTEAEVHPALAAAVKHSALRDNGGDAGAGQLQKPARTLPRGSEHVYRELREFAAQ